MEKICYAIMPYGGTDQSAIDRYNMVYQLYMFIPAMNKGFTVVREDIQALPGSITTNIVHHLAEAELVIADLSDANWNVAYELGIRHSLVKGKTILLCDDNTNLSFDIRGFNVIRYNGNNPADDMFAVQEKVRKAISARLTLPTKADNLVHEAFAFAHDNLISYINDEETEISNELAQVKSLCSVLQAENEALKEKLEKAGRMPVVTDAQESISRKINEAMHALQYSGSNAILQLRQAFAETEPNYNEIQSILQHSLAEGYWTEDNFRSAYHIFNSQGQPQLTNLILEVAEQQYPTSLDIKSYLADAYSDNYKTRDKAILYADEVLEVTIVDGKRYSRCKKIDENQLAACLNAYVGSGRFDIILELIPQLLDQIPEKKEMLLRNLAAAYQEVGDNEAQLETLETLLREYPMNDVNHYRVFSCLRKQNKPREAFYHLELASALDPDDTDYLLTLSGAVFDEHLCRTQDKQIKKVLRKEDCTKAALPFLMQAMTVETSARCLQRCKDFILRNGIGKYEEIFVQWINDGMESHGIPDLDYSGVDYLIALTDNLDEDLCSKIYVERTK